MAFKVIDLGLDFLLQPLAQRALKLLERLDGRNGLIVANLLEQGFDPLGGLRSAFAVKVVGHAPEMLVGVEEVQSAGERRGSDPWRYSISTRLRRR